MASSIDWSGERNRVIEDLTIDGQRNSINLVECESITIRRCRLLNAGGYSVVFDRCKKIVMEDCDIHGAGLTEWEAHGADCLYLAGSEDVTVRRVSLAGASHEMCSILKGSRRATFQNCRFGYYRDGRPIEARFGPGRVNGGSCLTIAGNSNQVTVEDTWFRGAPTGQMAHESHPVHHAVTQMHGTGHVFRRVQAEQCGKGLYLSGGQGQVTRDCLFEDVLLRDFAMGPDPNGNPGTAVELQCYDGPQDVMNNTWRRVQVWGAQQLLHAALTGSGNDLSGNRWEECAWGPGQWFVTQGSPSGPEDAMRRYPAAFKKNTSLTSKPPWNSGGGTDPVPPEPPVTGAAITSVSPSPVIAAKVATIAGQGLPGTAGVVWNTERGSIRVGTLSQSATRVTCTAPDDVLAGELYLRFQDSSQSNSVDYTVQGDEPPPTEPVRIPLTSGMVSANTLAYGLPAGALESLVTLQDGWFVRLLAADGTPLEQQLTITLDQAARVGRLLFRLARGSEGRSAPFSVIVSEEAVASGRATGSQTAATWTPGDTRKVALRVRGEGGGAPFLRLGGVELWSK